MKASKASDPTKTTRLEAEADPDALSKATKALARQGVTVQRAINLMLKYVALVGELPLDFFEPNVETKAAMQEVKRGDAFTANTVEGLMADLNADR